ncbi:thioredoxin-like protein [Naematelia encephala]|uniref:Thioredoxin-like protein n=1 Tax=Naematelia encephala TaxID=71784 RepID=A0A1Y2AZK3_9TREE|nr:thioredoxin-like protein [Naematelia encephala]
MRIAQLFLASLALWLQVVQAATIPIDDDDFELRQLTEDNFRASVAQGLWLVEHYSPKCSHCRAFAPTWTRLAKDKRHLERLSGFHMAQVNCLAQGDLCNANGIKFYPQLVLYSNGQPLPAYSGDRSYDDLAKLIDDQSTLYARGQLLDSKAEQEVVSSGFGRPNPEGKVLEVDESGLEVLIGNGPVLVDFFAPWCAHCKKLRPLYEELAGSLKSKINVAAVDCEAHHSYCRKHNIQGYPTIRLFQHDSHTDYNGPRTVTKMKAFASKAIETVTLQTIKREDFDDIVESNDAFFLYLQNFDTALSDLEAVKSMLEPLRNSISAYTSSDPLLYQNLSIANPPPTSSLLAFSAPDRLPVGTLAFPASKDRLERFVNLHRFPTLSQLSASNHQEIMKSPTRAVVVLGAVHKGAEGEKERQKLEQIARAWKRGGRSFAQPVWFVWVDGERWSAWLRQAYGIKKKSLPAVVVIDPPLSEYYDTTIEGTSVEFDGSSVFSVLEGFYQHFLRPKRSETSLEWGSRSATMTLITLSQASMDHPILAFFSVVGSVAAFVLWLYRNMKKDPREGRELTGGSRLD